MKLTQRTTPSHSEALPRILVHTNPCSDERHPNRPAIRSGAMGLSSRPKAGEWRHGALTWVPHVSLLRHGIGSPPRSDSGSWCRAIVLSPRRAIELSSRPKRSEVERPAFVDGQRKIFLLQKNKASELHSTHRQAARNTDESRKVSGREITPGPILFIARGTTAV
jgi:hypothetical protein